MAGGKLVVAENEVHNLNNSRDTVPYHNDISEVHRGPAGADLGGTEVKRGPLWSKELSIEDLLKLNVIQAGDGRYYGATTGAIGSTCYNI